MSKKIAIIGGAGFIGINLAISLSKNKEYEIYIIDEKEEFFNELKSLGFLNVTFREEPFSLSVDFDSQVKGADIVYHLASTNIPGTSNLRISDELESNVIVTAKLLDACVRQNVKKVIFVSSGGTVYGKKGKLPIKEEMVTYPITSYGIQKVTIEKMLYLYRYQEGLDYRVIRLANPYGPYQRPNGRLGVITTFVYHALKGEELILYGNGEVVRDFIFIDDAIRGIMKIADGESEYRTFNLGSGRGSSINDVIKKIREIVNPDIQIKRISSRNIDVPKNILDINRYEHEYGKLNPINLDDGIMKTAEFLKSRM